MRRAPGHTTVSVDPGATEPHSGGHRKQFRAWALGVALACALAAAPVAAPASSAAEVSDGPLPGPFSAAAAAATAGVAAAVNGERTIRLHAAVRELTTGRETRLGYQRDRFRDWYDADGDCRDTRDEVLAQESLVAVASCDVSTGRWYSYYDGRSWTSDDDVDIDHLVALAEAWDSGAKRWTAGTRDRYANDLGDRRTLVAVTDSVNQSKGDQDASEWLPDQGSCRYVREWVAVKLRWQLRVDLTERRRLTTLADGCANRPLTIHKRPSTPALAAGQLTGGTPHRQEALPTHVRRPLYERGRMSTVDLTAESFPTTVNDGIVLIDFWASWCGPCRQFAPIFEKAAGTHTDITFGKVDTEAEQMLAGQAGISSIPTLMAFRDGILLYAQPGAIPAAGLEELITMVRQVDMDQVREQLDAEEAARGTGATIGPDDELGTGATTARAGG